jgi:tRNA (mo5U34)-methyltransferase
MSTHKRKLELINSREWFHSIRVDEELVTPGKAPLSYLESILRFLRVSDSLEGLSVLDIGAWDGFFSFEAERRGAKRVVAYDLHPPNQYGFAVAKELLDSKVEYVQGSVYELSPGSIGTFDVVFFCGVLYHLRYPLLAVDRIWEVTKQYMLLETHCLDNRLLLPDLTAVPLSAVDERLTDVALYQFYRNDELNPGDYSNWFAPNRKAIEDSLWSAGFEPEFLANWDERVAYKAVRLPGTQEYKRQTYEGLEYVTNHEGTQIPSMPPRPK